MLFPTILLAASAAILVSGNVEETVQTITVTLPPNDSAVEVHYPRYAVVDRKARRAAAGFTNDMTNAERMRRGLPLNKPETRRKAEQRRKAKDMVAKRAEPPTAVASPGMQTFVYAGCSDSVTYPNDSVDTFFTADNAQAAANQCAAKHVASPYSSSSFPNFVLVDLTGSGGSGYYECYAATKGNTSPTTCSPGSFIYYTPAP